LQAYQRNPTYLLSQELTESYEAVNSLCATVEKKYGNNKVQMNPHQEPPINDQPIILTKELLELDITEEEWGDVEEQERKEEID
jgi:hypothetical protein